MALSQRQLIRNGVSRLSDAAERRGFQGQTSRRLAIPGDELVDGVEKLFKRYFERYATGHSGARALGSRCCWISQFYRDEIIAICQSSGITANEVAWLVRWEVRQMKRRWQNREDYTTTGMRCCHGQAQYRRDGSGVAILILGGVWAPSRCEHKYWLARSRC